jgi:hypothetical protein
MKTCLTRLFSVLTCITLTILLAYHPSAAVLTAPSRDGGPSHPAAVGAEPDAGTAEVLPEHLDDRDIYATVSTLSDAQVRRLLIDELKKNALQKGARKSANQEIGGIAGFILKIRKQAAFIRDRINFLRSGAAAAPEDLPKLFAGFIRNGGKLDIVKSLSALILLFAGSLVFELLFRRYTAPARCRLEADPVKSWWGQTGRLTLQC